LSQRLRILHAIGPQDQRVNVRALFCSDVDVVQVDSGLRALTLLARESFAAMVVDPAHFAEASQYERFLQYEKILEGMPDGILLLDAEWKVLWSNGRVREWTGRDNIIGEDFYKVFSDPEIVGNDLSPLISALTSSRPSSTTLRCHDSRFYQIHAAPVLEGDRPPDHLIVTIRDISEQMLQQQQMDAIHRAGIELADLTSDEVASMSFDERIELLKSNILHYTQDLLHFEVVEIRLLNPETGRLDPLLNVGMSNEAAKRVLYAKEKGFGVTGFVAATGKSYLCEEAKDDPLYLEGSVGARSSLTVPLIFHDEVIGTFNVESPEPSAFSESDVQFLEIFSRDVAVAINTLDILAAQQIIATTENVDAIHRAIALPVDDILIDAVSLVEKYFDRESDDIERLQRILRNARDIKHVVHQIGQSMAPAKAKPLSLQESDRPNLVNRRILVVDADQKIRSSAHDLLDRYNCIIETARTGSEAIGMVRNVAPSEKYDVIISDINLPDMNGYDLMLKLQEIVMQVPLVLMTGYGWDPGHTVVKARRAGLRFVLYKPFRLDQLLQTIEAMVEPGEEEK